MLDIKKLLVKILTQIASPINFSIVTKSSGNYTVGSGATQWITVDAPAGSIAMVGWYINGNGQRFSVYSAQTNANKGGTFAIKNTTTTSTTLKLDVQFLIKLGGVVRRLLNLLISERGWAIC